MVQGQSGGGLGDEVPQKLKGVRLGCPLPTGESGSGLGGGCAPFPDFLKFLSENGEFWCILGGTLCDLLTHLLNFKRNRGNVQVMCERTRGCVCPSYPNNSSAAHSNSSSRTQKRGFIRPCSGTMFGVALSLPRICALTSVLLVSVALVS